MTLGARRNHQVTVFHSTGYDPVTGAPTGVTTPAVPCLIEFGNKLIRAPSGDQVVSRAVVTTSHKVEVGDIITLPDGTSQAVIDVRPVSDLGGREVDREVYL